MGPADQKLRAVLAAGGGLAGRAQLLAADLSASMITRRLQDGELCAVVPGVYRAAGTPLTPELRLRAVSLRLGPAAVVTGRWAAWWHAIAGPASGPIAVIVPATGFRPNWPDLRAQRLALDRADRMTLRRLPVTTRARAVLDCAGLPGAEDIRDRALQRGTTILSLETALARMAPGRGTAAARALIEPVRQGGVSPPERELRRALTDRAGSRWRCGLTVAAHGRECWIDLAVEEIELAVEVDGWTVHSRSDAFGSDRERQNQLVRAGWTVLRYTPLQIRDHPDRVLAEIRAVENRLTLARRP